MDPERSQGANAPVSASESASAIAGDGGPTGEPGSASGSGKPATKAKRVRAVKDGDHPNNVRRLRQSAMMSKAELARRAGVSPLTIDRVEAGCPCRMDTKRKILEALGLQPSAAKDVFPEIELG
jgi:DNA-binding XRE family transcriptional regulator